MQVLEDSDMIELNNAAQYNAWKGQLYIHEQLVCDISLQTPSTCSIPAQLPEKLDVREVIQLSELRKKLPEDIFQKTDFTGQEVFCENVYYSSYPVVPTNIVESELDKVLKYLKDQDLALIKVLNDQGFLILVNSAILPNRTGIFDRNSVQLNALFLFPHQKFLNIKDREEWEGKFIRKELPLTVSNLLPGLHYAIIESCKLQKDKPLYPAPLVEQYFKKYAVLQRDEDSSSERKSEQCEPLSAFHRPADDFPQKCSPLAFSCLQLYISSPINFSVPVIKMNNILAENSFISSNSDQLGKTAGSLIKQDNLSSASMRAKTAEPKAGSDRQKRIRGVRENKEQSKRTTKRKSVKRREKKSKNKSVQRATLTTAETGENRSSNKRRRLLSEGKKPIGSSSEATVKLANVPYPQRRKRGAEVLSAAFIQHEKIQTSEKITPGNTENEKKKILTAETRAIKRKVQKAFSPEQHLVVPDRRSKRKMSVPGNTIVAAEVINKSESLKKISERKYGSTGRAKKRSEEKKTTTVEQINTSGKSSESLKDAPKWPPPPEISEDNIIEKRINMYESHALNLLADLALNSFGSTNIPYLQSVNVASAPDVLVDEPARRDDPVSTEEPPAKDFSPPAPSTTAYTEPENTMEGDKPKNGFNVSPRSIASQKRFESGEKQISQKAHIAAAKAKARYNATSKICLEHSYSQLPLGIIPGKSTKETNERAIQGVPDSTTSADVVPESSVNGLSEEVVFTGGSESLLTGNKQRGVSKLQDNVVITVHWEPNYNFDLDSKFTSDPLEKTINRALHGPWNPHLKEKVEDVKIILHMWIALFYSKSKKQIHCNSRKVVEHSNPAKYVSINTVLDPFEFYEIRESDNASSTTNTNVILPMGKKSEALRIEAPAKSGNSDNAKSKETEHEYLRNFFRINEAEKLTVSQTNFSKTVSSNVHDKEGNVEACESVSPAGHTSHTRSDLFSLEDVTMAPTSRDSHETTSKLKLADKNEGYSCVVETESDARAKKFLSLNIAQSRLFDGSVEFSNVAATEERIKESEASNPDMKQNLDESRGSSAKEYSSTHDKAEELHDEACLVNEPASAPASSFELDTTSIIYSIKNLDINDSSESTMECEEHVHKDKLAETQKLLLMSQTPSDMEKTQSSSCSVGTVNETVNLSGSVVKEMQIDVVPKKSESPACQNIVNECVSLGTSRGMLEGESDVSDSNDTALHLNITSSFSDQLMKRYNEMDSVQSTVEKQQHDPTRDASQSVKPIRSDKDSTNSSRSSSSNKKEILSKLKRICLGSIASHQVSSNFENVLSEDEKSINGFTSEKNEVIDEAKSVLPLDEHINTLKNLEVIVEEPAMENCNIEPEKPVMENCNVDKEPAVENYNVEAEKPVVEKFSVEAEEPAVENCDVEAEEPAVENCDVEAEEPAMENCDVEAEEPAMESCDVEAEEPAVENCDVQTEEPAVENCSVEAEQPALENCDVETEEPAIENRSAEAEDPAVENCDVETQEPAMENCSVEAEDPTVENCSVEAEDPTVENCSVEAEEPAMENCDVAAEEPAVDNCCVEAEEPAVENYNIEAEEPAVENCNIEAEEFTIENCAVVEETIIENCDVISDEPVIDRSSQAELVNENFVEPEFLEEVMPLQDNCLISPSFEDVSDCIEQDPSPELPDICFIVNTGSISKEQYDRWSETSDDDIEYISSYTEPLSHKKDFQEDIPEPPCVIQEEEQHLQELTPATRTKISFRKHSRSNRGLYESDENMSRHLKDREYNSKTNHENVTVTRNMKDFECATRTICREISSSDLDHVFTDNRTVSDDLTQNTLDVENVRFSCNLKEILRKSSKDKYIYGSRFQTMFDSRRITSCSHSRMKCRNPLLITVRCPYRRTDFRRHDARHSYTYNSSPYYEDELWDEPVTYSKTIRKVRTQRYSPFHFSRLRYETPLDKSNSDISVILNECVQSNHLNLSSIGLGSAAVDRTSASQLADEGSQHARTSVPASYKSQSANNIISNLCTSLHSRLQNVARETEQKMSFYIYKTDDGEFISSAKGLLVKDGHIPIDPWDFLNNEQCEYNQLLVIIKNEDVVSCINKIPCLMQLKLLHNVTFAGVDTPEDLAESTYEELFQTGGFVVSDKSVLESITLGKLKEVLAVLEKMSQTSPWKWLIHYRENRKLKEDKRTEVISQAKMALLKSYQQSNIIEILPYHQCDSRSKESSDDLACLLNLQYQHIHSRLAVYLTGTTSTLTDMYEQNGVLVYDVDTFLRKIQKVDSQLQTLYRS